MVTQKGRASANAPRVCRATAKGLLGDLSTKARRRRRISQTGAMGIVVQNHGEGLQSEGCVSAASLTCETCACPASRSPASTARHSASDPRCPWAGGPMGRPLPGTPRTPLRRPLNGTGAWTVSWSAWEGGKVGWEGLGQQ